MELIDGRRDVILGLDVSTTTTGFAILDYDGNLIESGYIILNQKSKGEYLTPTLLSKSILIDSHMKDWDFKYCIKEVFIEAPAQGGFGGKTTANTLSKLLQFNGIVTYMAYKQFDVIPEHINVRSARKLCGIKNVTGEKSSERNKINVAEFFVGLYEDLMLEYTRKGNIKKQELDRTDAICIAYSGYLKNKKQ